MATGVGMGFDLSKLESEFKKLDEQLGKLMKKGETFKDEWNKIFTSMGKEGLSSFASQLAKMRKDVVNFGKVKVGIKWDSVGLQKYIDDVNRLIYVIKNVQQETKKEGIKNLSIQGLKKEVKDARELLKIVKETEDTSSVSMRNLAAQYEAEEKYNKKRQDNQKSQMEAFRKFAEERAKLEQQATDRNKANEHKRLQAEWQAELKARDEAEKAAIKAEEERYKQQEKQRVANAVATSNNLDKLKEQQHRKELQEIKEEEVAANRKHQNEIDRINKRFDLIRKREENQRRETQAKLNTTQGALGAYNQLYSPQGVRSLNQMKTVLKQLETAQADINRATKEGQRDWKQVGDSPTCQVGDAIKRVKGDIERTEKEMGKFHNRQKGVLDTSGQLARALAAAFSVSAIRGYVNKLMQIRGEFEMQQRSLQVLLQNKDEANALWDKTVALAVKSPFTTKQLITYTKQLAAYRVESDKLYETNKMLADVSAGLGVDMNRLILAFGQVKAANFLRGTELRQFSEAGVNMLDELAKRFTALEGRAVSVGEVFERVSKRMVSFADVEAVFKTITSEGGIFYQMQEKQSETLKGMMLNLKDSYELMLNDIGKSNEDMLKGFVSMMKSIVDNWQILSEVLKGVGAALVLYKLSIASTNRDLIAMALQMGVVNKTGTKQLTILNLLTLGFKKLTKGVKGAGSAMKAFMTSNAITLFITSIIYVLYKLYNAFSKHQEQLEEITKKYSDLRKEVATINVKFTYAENKNELKESLNKLADFAKQNSISVDVNVEGLDEEQLKVKFNNLNNQILNTLAFAESFSKAISNSDSWWQLSDGIIKDFEQFSASAQTLSTTLRNEIANLIDYLTKTGQLTDELRDAFKPRNIAGGESELEYIERVSAAYEKYLKTVKATSEETKKGGHASVAGNYNRLVKLWGKDLYDSVIKTRNAIDDFNAKQKEATEEFIQFKDELKIPALLNDKARTAYIKAAIDQKAFDDFTKEMWYRLANQHFSVNIAPTTPEKKEITGWVKEYNKFVGTLKQGVDKEGNTLTIVKPMQADTDPTEYLNKLKGTYERLQKDIEAWDAKNAKARAQYTEDEINAIKAQNAERKKAIDWLEYDKKKNKKEESEELKRLKEQIRLVRQLADDYEEMWKKYGKAYADANIKSDARTNAFAGLKLDIDDFEVGTRENEKNNLGKLLEKALGIEGGKVEVEKAVADVEVEVRWDLQEQANANLSREFENLFGNYEISLELEKLNIPPDLAKQLFGIDSIDLTTLRKELLNKVGLGDMASKTNADILNSDAYKNLHEHQRKELADHLQKVSQMEQKEQEERLKRYAKFLTKGFNKRINLKIQELRELEKLEEDKENFTPQEYETIKKGIQDEYAKKISEQEWKDFEQSAQYINLFDDIENSTTTALENMKARLEELKDGLMAAGMDAKDLKEILSQLNQVEEEIDSRQPFKAFADDVKSVISGIKEQIRLRKEEKTIQYKINRLRKEMPKDETVTKEQVEAKSHKKYGTLQEAKRNLSTLEEGTLEYEQQVSQVNKLEEEITPLTVKQRKVTEELEKQNKLLNKNQSKQQGWNKDIGKIGDDFTKFGDRLKQVGSFVSDMASKWDTAFGLSDKAKDDLEMIAGVAQGAGDMVQGVGKALSGDIFSGVLQGASGIMGIASAIGARHDKKKERQIQAEIKLVERLQKVYEDLGETIENAYSLDTLNEATQMSRENLIAQINATERMIAAEKGKKDTDWDRIDEWKEQIEEYKEMMKELEETRLQELGGFASDENKKSGAEAFLDAWMEAYKETGNGLIGLDKQFDEFFEGMVKRQLLQRGSDKFLNNFFNEFDNLIAKSAEPGADMSSTLRQIQDNWDRIKPQYNSFLEELMELFNLDDEFRGSAGELGGLSAGISGITEDQADVLAAYWSSVRLLTADTNTKVTELVTKLFSDDATVNPMLSQLKAILAQTTAIRDLFDSVVGRGNGGTHSGAYLKVAVG